MRGTLVRLATALFAFRALIPVGFMPAPFSDGGPVVLCHGGVTGAFFRALHEAQASTDAHMHTADHSAATADGHRHRDADPDASHEAWEYCPVGAAFSATAVPQEFALSLLESGHSFEHPEPDAIIRIALFSSYRARAPPAGFSRHTA
jgi:hypothetical protein